MSRHGAWKDEQGFTLIELMIVVTIMGIVFAIASSSWFDTIESRRVDSATNQVVADLRLVHTQASNRLAEYNFVVTTVNSSTYQIGPSGGTLDTQTLPEGTRIAGAINIVFDARGGARLAAGVTPNPISIRVESSKYPAKFHNTIEINTVTSRIRIVP